MVLSGSSANAAGANRAALDAAASVEPLGR
jgi:hypothetical protein